HESERGKHGRQRLDQRLVQEQRKHRGSAADLHGQVAAAEAFRRAAPQGYPCGVAFSIPMTPRRRPRRASKDLSRAAAAMSDVPFAVRKAAVLGAGVMGAQIAAHLANASVPVVLFDLAAKEGRRDMARQMQDAYIVAATRTPVGKAPRGALKNARPDSMLSHVLKSVLARLPGVDPVRIDDVIVGCAMPEYEQGMNVARIGVLLAGLPKSVAGMTVNRFCSSGLNAVSIAA